MDISLDACSSRIIHWLSRLGVLADDKNGHIRIQVWLVKNLDVLFRVQRNAAAHVQLLRLAKIFKIGDREKADIGGVIPFMTEDASRFGSAAVIARACAAAVDTRNSGCSQCSGGRPATFP